METLLFKPKLVNKFFTLLENKGRFCNPLYDNKCEKQIFVQRTLDKWFKNKYIILYSVKNNIHYKQYIFVNGIRFGLGYSDYLVVYYFDASTPFMLYNEMKLTQSDCNTLEGEWCQTSTEHINILKLLALNIQEKEYVFKYYDISKAKDGFTKLSDYESNISFKAKTLHEAYFLKRNHPPENNKFIGELIEVKEIT